jgi:hypothetical protein
MPCCGQAVLEPREGPLGGQGNANGLPVSQVIYLASELSA